MALTYKEGQGNKGGIVGNGVCENDAKKKKMLTEIETQLARSDLSDSAMDNLLFYRKCINTADLSLLVTSFLS